MTVFFRLLESSPEEKATSLLDAVSACVDSDSSSKTLPIAVFETDAVVFSSIPKSPFAYWVSIRIRELFKRLGPFESETRTVKQGLATADDFRFVRTWWEVNESRIGERWFSFAKGGASSRYYADVYLVVAWWGDGAEAKAWAGSLYNGSHWSRILKNTHLFFRAGLTWPRRTQSGFGVRAMPSGCIFADKGPATFADGDDSEHLLALLALMTCQTFSHLIALQMAFGSYEVGVVQRTPVPDMGDGDITVLARLAHRSWSLKRLLDTTNETSHAFLLPSGLNEKETGLDVMAVERQLANMQQEIDEHTFRLYGIAPADRLAIEESSKRNEMTADSAAEPNEEHEEDEMEAFVTEPSDTLFSWLVGVAFGRFDLRLAVPSEPRPISPEPEPFERLPSRSPGMWPHDEFPVMAPPDIMVADAGHDHDLCFQVAAAASATGCPDRADLRQWLAREFFPLHIKMYSKSRRKAPIYWQLATPSASYSVWLYMHAFTKDTIFRVQNDYVAPKLAHEERKLEGMASAAREKGTAAERKAIAAQEDFVGELRAFLDEVKRVAPLWNPDLDDGVIINFAPLWRLVPQHKPWQKELKATWDALCAGKYDWAHLAMHLWPERVVPECATDRSFAIAHGLEEAFWVGGSNGKWVARTTPASPIDDLVRERTSPAVKAALQSLLDAPHSTGAGRKARKG